MKYQLRIEYFLFRSLFRFTRICISKAVGVFLCLFFLIPYTIFSQQNVSLNKISPELQNQVLATLRESSKKFQLISNDGQLGLPPNVIAYFSTQSQTIFVEKDRLRIIVLDPDKKSRSSQLFYGSGREKKNTQTKYRYNSFNIRFIGSKDISRVEESKPFETRRNYINSNSPQHNITNVASYEEVTLKNIYDGIDLRLYSQEQGQLEFDWIIWPGADPRKIKMQFAGQKKLFISEKGHLQISLPMGNFFMHMPESYYVTPDGKKNAECQFKLLAKNTVEFKLAKIRDDRYPLIIDPNLLWGTFFDGGNAGFDEYLYSIEYNYNNQLIYCAGVANQQVSTSYVSALSSGYSGTFIAGQDVLAYALTKNGQTIQYITYLGGTGNDVATGVSIGGSNIFICGYTESTDFPVTTGSGGTTAAFDNSLGGTRDGFVAVFNSSLNTLSYCTYIGGTGTDESLTIRANSSTSFYVSLHSYSSLPTSSPNYLVNYADNSFGGTEEAWIGEFTSFNTLRFGTYIGGTDVDVINDFQLLSDGDVVFAGTTKQITEVNEHVPSNATGSDALFGRIDVPASGAVSFAVIEKFGGSGTDNAYGIYSLGDSVSIIVGGTKSSNFPLGSGTPFQNSIGTSTDGFIARINNDGSGGYKASFVGATGADMMVSVRPITINNQVVLLSFGTTSSTNLAVTNFNAESFYSGTNSGGQDMMFLICDFNFVNKYYLSYIGGTGNDYLGATGVPVGSNHLFYNSVDSVLYVGTTTHSYDSTQNPKFVGRGIADVQNAYVPVFDKVKNNGTNDTHVIFAIATNTIYTVLFINWTSFETNLNPDCSVGISWEVAQQSSVNRFIVERSFDGNNFLKIAEVTGGLLHYSFTDLSADQLRGNVFYRIHSIDGKGYSSYSRINAVRLCQSGELQIKIYPTIASDHITIDAAQVTPGKDALFQLYNSEGKMVMKKRIVLNNGISQITLNTSLISGPHFIKINDAATGALLHLHKIIILKK